VRAVELVASWPVGVAAAGWLARQADSAWTGDHIGDVERPFALASVTKPLVAMALLVAVEERTIGLDESVPIAGSTDIVTVRHLLAHAGGVGPDDVSPIAAPGTKRIYSNAGFELLGVHLAHRSGMTTRAYLAEAIAAPLGLTTTKLVASPAHGAWSSVADLLAVARELLAPTLLHPSTIAEASSVQFPGLDGVLPGFGRQRPNDWGLGFELRSSKQPHWTGAANSPATFGHFGRTGTMLWVDPVAQCAAVALTDTEFGPWAADAWPAFSDAVLAEAAR
jgi:CubicO group peptidase (beta-lactamase class C family)